MRAHIEIRQVGLRGQGVGTDPQGNIYFVPRALPGDIVEVEFVTDAKRYRDAVLVDVIKAAPERRESPCPHFQLCGGCDWLHWDYGSQLRGKDATVKHVLERARIDVKHLLPIIASGVQAHYRNRIQLRHEEGRLGFFRRRSHELVAIHDCWVAAPRLNEEIRQLEAERPPKAFQKVELMLEEDGRVSRIYDAPHGSSGFVQVNSRQNEVIRDLVGRHIRALDSRQVLELFCGDGNLTFAYGAQPHRVIAVDSNGIAIQKGEGKRVQSGFLSVEFLRANVDWVLPAKLPGSFQTRYDTLLLDPPRQGVGKLLSQFVHARVAHVIYVSCSPVSFAQDIKPLIQRGFALYELQPVDMFPHTHHIELVARLSRDS